MATQTTNLNLVKPDYTDAADIAVINSNMDIVDSHVHGNDVDIAGIATIITGTTNNSGHSISSGEYFIANGAKYKATATIGTGVTWADKATSVSDHDLINALNSKIEPFGTHELLVTHRITTAGAFSEITLEQSRKISSYRYIGMAIKAVGQIMGTMIMPTEYFISLSTSVASVLNTYTDARHYVGAKYISDTKIQILTDGVYYIDVFGIK